MFATWVVFRNYPRRHETALNTLVLLQIRFRAAWKAQGHSVEELPFKAAGGVYGSWFGVILLCLVLVAQFYV